MKRRHILFVTFSCIQSVFNEIQGKTVHAPTYCNIPTVTSLCQQDTVHEHHYTLAQPRVTSMAQHCSMQSKTA